MRSAEAQAMKYRTKGGEGEAVALNMCSAA